MTERRWLVAALAVAAVACLPMWAHPQGFLSGDPYRDNDWLTDRLFDLLARRAILEEGVFPLRSALVGGGYPTIAHPFDGSWAPTLVAILLLGPVHGVKANLLLLALVGALGTFRLARDWVELPAPAAAFAAAAFGALGWLPSMMLVGFAPQMLLFVVPLLFACVLRPRSRADRVLAGFLGFLLLQQAGNALLAALAVGAWALWLDAGRDARGWGRLLPPVALLLAGGSVALGRRYDAAALGALGLLGAAGLVAGTAPLRAAAARVRAALPALLVAAVVAGTLGIGKLVGLVPLVRSVPYAHAANVPPTAWPDPTGAPPRPSRDEHFHPSGARLLRALLDRAPADGIYAGRGPSPLPLDQLDGVDLRTAVGEYGHLGLTPPLLLLALAGLVVGLRRGGARGTPAVLALLVLAACLGPHVPGDPYHLLAGGLPGLEGLRQPVKYYSFFLALCVALLAGVGVDAIARRRPAAARLLPLVLLWPLAQNAPAWADRFALPSPADWRCNGCAQVKQIGHRDWATLPAAEIERRERVVMLRELRPPPEARAYDNALRGVGTVDWYGTLERPDVVQASHYVTPRREVLPNPDYAGPARVEGPGRVRDVRMGTLRIGFTAELMAPARVVLNASHDPGFVPSVGAVADAGGLLAVDLPAGTHAVALRYRPWPQIAGLLTSAAFALLWAFTGWRLRGRAAGA